MNHDDSTANSIKARDDVGPEASTPHSPSLKGSSDIFLLTFLILSFRACSVTINLSQE